MWHIGHIWRQYLTETTSILKRLWCGETVGGEKAGREGSILWGSLCKLDVSGSGTAKGERQQAKRLKKRTVRVLFCCNPYSFSISR
jgi:hypothetical protein